MADLTRRGYIQTIQGLILNEALGDTGRHSIALMAFRPVSKDPIDEYTRHVGMLYDGLAYGNWPWTMEELPRGRGKPFPKEESNG